MSFSAAILLDTGNLNESFGKTTARDVNVIKRLTQATGSDEGEKIGAPTLSYLQKIYDDAITAKFDVVALTTTQLMRKVSCLLALLVVLIL